MGVSWRELVTALWRATTVDCRTSLHEEKEKKGAEDWEKGEKE